MPKNYFSKEYLESRDKLLNDINLDKLDRKDCFFYENTYFDRRHYVIDVMNFYQFLLLDVKGDDFKYKSR